MAKNSTVNGNGAVKVIESASDLTPDPRNANKGTDRGQKLLSGSLAKYGAGRSILADRHGAVIAGNKTLAQAVTHNMPVKVVQTDGTELVVVQRTDLDLSTDVGAKELAIADNRVAQIDLDWNTDILESLSSEIDLTQFWQKDELSELLGSGGMGGGDDPGADIDRAAELQAKWKTELGQLWTIGRHRLLCGDCTVRENVERVMGGEVADTLVSDPPYGIGYEYDKHDDSGNAANLELVKAAFAHGPTAKVWTCGAMNLGRDLSWNVGAKVLCWHKGFAQAGNGIGGASTWEPVLVVGVKQGTLPNDYLDFSTDRVPGLRDLHSCPKPVALFAHLIEHLAGSIVYDPFCGSGTTLVACEQLGRQGRGLEISPAYCAVILERLSGMNLKPELVTDA